jgi:uncharacterized protein (DUF58 family)
MPESLPLLDPALLERINGLSLTARRVVEGALHGLHRSPRHGLSIEFAQHRQYTAGDELKHLDWKVLAKSDRYVVKQYEQETNLRALLLVDTSASMAFAGSRTVTSEKPAATNPTTAPSLHDDKFRYASTLAVALAYLLLQQGDSVGLVLTGEQPRSRVEPSGNPNHVMAISHALVTATPAGTTDLRSAVQRLAGGLRRRSLIVLISDLLDDPAPILAALGQAHHAGHEVLIFQVLDPAELDFDLGKSAQGVTVIRDIETGAEFESEPAMIRDLVRDEVARFLKELDDGARRHGVHLVRCSTNEPVHAALSHYLHRRDARHA